VKRGKVYMPKGTKEKKDKKEKKGIRCPVEVMEACRNVVFSEIGATRFKRNYLYSQEKTDKSLTKSHNKKIEYLENKLSECFNKKDANEIRSSLTTLKRKGVDLAPPCTRCHAYTMHHCNSQKIECSLFNIYAANGYKQKHSKCTVRLQRLRHLDKTMDYYCLGCDA
jgi:hypothetical protein